LKRLVAYLHNHDLDAGPERYYIVNGYVVVFAFNDAGADQVTPMNMHSPGTTKRNNKIYCTRLGLIEWSQSINLKRCSFSVSVVDIFGSLRQLLPCTGV
jgi:hypothetical protein